MDEEQYLQVTVDCIKSKVLPGFEPRTFRVLGERDDHYTTEPPMAGQMDQSFRIWQLGNRK